MSNQSIQSEIEKCFHKRRENVYKKVCKKVVYGDDVFISAAALARYLKMGSPGSIYNHIRNGVLNGKRLLYLKDIKNK